MPWDRSRPRSQTYGGEHAAIRRRHMAALRHAGSGLCAEIRCVQPTRYITADMDLHLCHDRSTGQVLGLGHRQCNLSEAARWARSIQQASALRW